MVPARAGITLYSDSHKRPHPFCGQVSSCLQFVCGYTCQQQPAAAAPRSLSSHENSPSGSSSAFNRDTKTLKTFTDFAVNLKQKHS